MIKIPVLVDDLVDAGCNKMCDQISVQYVSRQMKYESGKIIILLYYSLI